MTSKDSLARLRRQLEQESTDGVLLLNNIESNPICEVSFDPSVPCVAIVWKRYVTSLQLRYVHEHILEMLIRHKVGKLLADDTALPTVHAEDRRWIVEDWMPRAIAAGFVFGASKASAAYFGRISTNEIRSAAPNGLQIRFFESLDDARVWLKAQPA